PTAFRQLIRVEEQRLTTKPLALRYVIFGGEALDPRILKPWFTRHGDQTPQLVNMYGITETTVHVTYRPLTQQDMFKQDSVIGHPIPDLQVYILDENLQPVPAGTIGEMYIGGAGVARGYLNREQLNKERFITNPFTTEKGQLYKTGDLARYNESHEIEFIGRNDHQVKVRGFRIELGEIEAILNSHSLINDSVVTVKHDDNGEEQIVAYLVTSGQMPLPSAIRKYVKGKLPSYMVPNIVAPIKYIPTTVNGKLDYKSLPWPVINEGERATEPINMQEEILQDFGAILKQKIEPVDNVFDLGATSLTIVNITQKIQQNYGVSVPVEVFLESTTIKDIIQYIERESCKLLNKENKNDEIKDEDIQSMEQFLQNLVQEIIQVTDIDNDEDIFNLGVTSLSIINIAQKIKEKKGISIPVEVFLENPTISGIAGYICKQFLNEGPITKTYTSNIQREPLSMALNPIEFEDKHYLSTDTALMKGYRKKVLSFKEFSELIGLLKMKNIDGKGRYLYPSAGGKYAIQSYVVIKKDSVKGINEGIYYYHPEKHALLLVNTEVNIPASVFMHEDQTIFNQSGICLFFVAQLEALTPFYGEFSAGLATIDAGYINQLFVGRKNKYDFDLHPIEALNFSEIEDQFVLDKNHKYVHSIVVGNFKSQKQNMSKIQREEELRGYLESGNHQIVPIKDMSKTIQYPSLTAEQIEWYKNQKLHLRLVKETDHLVLLEEDNIPEEDYHVRFCYREYDKQELKFEELSKLLSLLRRNRGNKEEEYLYFPIRGQRSINIYLYIKNGAIEGIKQGVYKYNPDENQLELIKDTLSYKLEYTHSPFNRIHYRNSAFSIFLTTKLTNLERIYKDYGLQYASFEVGNMGQLMLDRQAECNVGLVPIGGLNFDKIRDDFGLEADEHLIHSFLGGSVKHEHARNPNDILQIKALNGVEEKIKSDIPVKSSEEIAIIGLSGKYPEAKNMEGFWENLQIGKHSITNIDEERSMLYGWVSSKESNNRKEMWGGYLKDIDKFDSLLFNISPAEAKQMDPQERLSLETSWECLEDAGYTSDSLKKDTSKIGVFVGAMWNDYQEYGIEEWNENGEAHIAALHASIANRINHYFGFNGPSIALNTSCSSSLTAIHMAIESVRKGECGAALVLGVNIMSHPYHYESLLQQGLLSENEKSCAFSINGSGLVPGEGIGAILIKPLENAVKNKDHIYGIIKGSVINHYGETARYGMPNSNMQMQSIIDVLEKTGTLPHSISYIECAATGSSIADASEIKALTEVFGDQDLIIGSLKPNIGHLESASTMSQLTKVLLQLKNKKLAPTIHSQPINPLIPIDQYNIKVVTDLEEWDSKDGEPRRSIISSYGATGSIGNLLIEEYIDIDDRVLKESVRTEVCIPFSANSEVQLFQYIDRFLRYLNTMPNDGSLEEIAHTLYVGRQHMKERLVVVACSISDLINKLQAFALKRGQIQGVYKGTAQKLTDYRYKEYTSLSTNAQSWVKGEKVTLNQHIHNVKKVSLPTYPFNKVSHWCKSLQNFDIKEINSDVEERPIVSSVLKERVEKYLMSIFAQVTEIPIKNIDLKNSFEAYGINSLLITKMNERLERDLGSISKTLFFENQSIEELALNMINKYEQIFLKLFKEETLEPKEVVLNKTPDFQKIESVSKDITPDDIAIVGISGKYPDADNLQTFWGNLKSGIDSITEVPLERWDYRKYYNPEKGKKGTVYGKWGGFIKDVDKFDPLFFNISPKEAELIDPQERLFLQVAWECIEDSGYTRQLLNQKHKGNIGVFSGVMYQEYTLHSHCEENGEEMNFALGSSAGSIANRVSYFFNFQGPSLTIDTMCSSALTSLHYAAESVKRGECEVAIVGGVNLLLHPNKYLMHSQMHMLSTDGRCRSFGKGGDGFVPGEGIGAILIKPLQKAVEDGDNIYAVIKGTAINNDGKTNGYTVPNPKQQEDVINKALNNANVNPRTISYIEAHGTGTALGDPIEIAGLSNAYKKFTHDTQFCSIGSVKSNIGHCESAAGIAGITKVVLQLKHKLLVPSLHAEELNPNITFEETPFYVQRELTEWEKPTLLINGREECLPRRAGISSFGAGGVNAHIILEEYVPQEEKVESQESREIILLSARTQQELKEYATELLSFLKHSTREIVQDDKDLLLEKVTQYVARSIKIECSDLDIQENIGSYFDGIAYKDLTNMLFAEFEKDIELPSIIEGFSIQTLVDRIASVIYLESVRDSKKNPICLKDIAYTLKVGREPMQHRLALIVASIDELIEKVECFIKEQSNTLDGVFYSVDNEYNKINYFWNESEIQDVLQRWILNNELTKLAQIWIAGVNVEWEKNGGGNKRRISLPTYPFKKEKYWLSNTVINSRNSSIETLHPLIDSNISTLDEQCFEKTFYKKDIFTQQYGSEFISALIPLEMVRKASELSLRDRVVRQIQEVTCNSPLSYVGDTNNSSIIMYRIDNETHFAIESLESESTTLNYEGCVVYADSYDNCVDDQKINLDAMQKAFQHQINKDQLYEEFAERGWIIHQELKNIQNVYYTENEALTKINIPSDQNDFVVHPIALDGIMQSIIGMNWCSGKADILPNQPYYIKNVHINGYLGGLHYIYILRNPELENSYDIKISNENGEVLVSLEKLLFEGMETASERNDNGISNNIRSDQKFVGNKANPDARRKCLDIISQVLGLGGHTIELKKSFSEYGLDSISITEISNKLQKDLGIDVKASRFFEAACIEDFLEEIVPCTLETLEKIEPSSILSKASTNVIAHKKESPKKRRRVEKSLENNDSKLKEPIAIIGMDGRLPGADTIEEFWKNISKGETFISEVPGERWDWKSFYGNPTTEENRTDVKYGGFLKDVDKFDCKFFGISPNEAKLMDPQQRLFLETVWKTIEDAGYKASSLSGSKTGVFVGATTKDYEQLMSDYEVPIEAYMATGNSHSILANRISYFYNLTGPSEAIDTACSSSLVALHRAIQSIRLGECETAIAGGVNLLLSPKHFISYRKAGMLSPDEKVKTFDKDANGYLRGEGIGAVLLKPLSQAEKDGDHIYAVIKGSAVNHSGKGFALTAPNPSIQAKAIQEAWRQAEVDPNTISYIEAQGTGTLLGDVLEIDAFKTAIEHHPMDINNKCGIGSVKPNIGHIEAASGIASIFKVIKSFEHKMIPKTINITELNPEIQLEGTPFYIVDETVAWKTNIDEQKNPIPRRAAIHSFGVGGSNVHVVLEEYQRRKPNAVVANSESPYIFTCSAKNSHQLREYVKNMLQMVCENTSVNFGDFIYTCQVARESMEERIAIVVQDREDFINKCNLYLEGSNHLYSWLYRGNKYQNDNDILNIFQEGVCEYIIQDSLREQDFTKIAVLWTKGIDFDWSSLYVQQDRMKVLIPTYPFERNRHWITDYRPASPLVSEKTNLSDNVLTKNTKEQLVDISNEGHSVKDTFIDSIKQAISNILGFSRDEISENVPLYQLGFDSVSATKLKYWLESELGVEVQLSILNNNMSVEDCAEIVCSIKKTNILSGDIDNNSIDISSIDVDALSSKELDNLFAKLKD
ncbi:beta-ketoacyl synthase N-terminal-like domain-containing protein, partial [Bacillus mobilis]|uniref:beta-ketoacyl synthase N-terminal-like domain-containing protein n=1 Tax=Bacillus mobilis TaxID=2026190 RepID=UPI002E219CD1|nr:beta-ketoacyl synthase N-terminal-like domain-containing protein [Bacillus mobilis]